MLTPFFRTILEGTNICEDEPDFNYTSYDIFCLRTKLEATVNSLLGPEYEISMVSIPKDMKMVIAVYIIKDGQRLSPDPRIEKAINLFTTKDPNFALLYRPERPIILETGQIIPVAWIQNMLPYVRVDATYNPFFNELGLHVNLLRVPSYNTRYNELLQEVRSQLIDLYLRGYILQAGSIADDWNLEIMDSQGLLYRPRWFDRSFAPDLVEFLRERMAGEEFIQFKVGYNNVVRHVLAQELGSEEFYFIEDELRIKAASFLVAAQLSSLVGRIVPSAAGQVAIVDQPTENSVKYKVEADGKFTEVYSILVEA